VAILLRFSLAILNREANDAHEAVANLIIQTGKLPNKDDCWECFQPKLYHIIFAKSLQFSGMENKPAYQQNVMGQAINFLAGIITLVIVYLFIRGLPEYSEKLKFLAFALVALNPNLIGINSQATNDTFAILFSTLAIFFVYKYIKQKQLMDLIFCSIFVILGISTKVNAWVTAIAIVIALLIMSLLQEYRKKRLIIVMIFIFAIIIFSIINPLSQYISNYQKYGSPILLNIKKDPFPQFSGEYSADASGIWYIGDGFFTFKFLDLLKHPRLDPGTSVYLPHQTSFWTVLYGRGHSIHFDNAPPSWSTTDDSIFPLLRVLYTLAIIPTILLLSGAVRDFYDLAISFIKRRYPVIQSKYYGLFLFILIGYISFQVLYSLQYRSVTVIKTIFIFPALLSFPLFFMQASKRLYSFLSKRNHWTIYLFDSTVSAILFCYVVDVTILIVALAQIYMQKHPF
jgi:hypothetical protein